jgi:hypothetical protein
MSLVGEERCGGMGCRPTTRVGGHDRLSIVLLARIRRRGPFLVFVGDQIDEGRGRVSPVWLSSMPVRTRSRDVEREGEAVRSSGGAPDPIAAGVQSAMIGRIRPPSLHRAESRR